MRFAVKLLVLLVGQALVPSVVEGFLPVSSLWTQEVVDRIVARIENDIITLSEVHELARFQQLREGRAARDAELISQLIEQWIVGMEAASAHFPRPAQAEVALELERVEKQFASLEAYHARLRELGLTAAGVRRLVERQLYLTRYLDYKFRPAAQVDAQQIEKYYREQLVPQLVERTQPVPPLERVQEQIRELLTQREINERAGRWLDETKSRLRIERESGDNAS